MSSPEDPRQYTLRYLFEKCGFQFNEVTDLSPDTRRRIGELAGEVQQVWALDSQIASAKVLKAKGTPLARVPATLGVLLVVFSILGSAFLDSMGLVFLLGLGLIVLAVPASWRHRRRAAATIAEFQSRRNEQWRGWTSRADALSVDVLEDSRAVYRQKVRPRVVEVKLDFAEVMRAAHGKGVILDKIKCPSCGAAVNLPPSGDLVKCSYCGNEVTATSVLEKMKSILA